MPKTIMLMGRKPFQLGEHELRELQSKYGKDVQFVSSNACTSEEHLAECTRVKPDVVLLPSDEPYFADAVREGVQHIVYASGRKGRWGLYVIWNLVRYPFRSFFRTFPVELAYFNDRPR
jgi:nitrate reductase beta subunit